MMTGRLQILPWFESGDLPIKPGEHVGRHMPIELANGAIYDLYFKWEWQSPTEAMGQLVGIELIREPREKVA